MKKQTLAVVTSLFVASAFSALGQDWVTIDDAKGGLIQDNFTNPGHPMPAYSGDVTVEVLWARTGVSDPFPGTTENNALTGNSDITYLLDNGWTLAQNYSSGSGTAALGLVTTTAFGATATTKNAGGVAAFNGGISFEVNTVDLYGGSATGDSGDNIQMVYIVMNGANTSYMSASAIGLSDPFLNKVGSSATDANGDFGQGGDTDEVTGGTSGPAQFFLGVPEPTTLALAGVGGLSMLFFRRRQS